jgi:nucleoside-diphosphate-sugar epimerase
MNIEITELSRSYLQKIQKELGYKPQFSFEVGIQETINSIKESNN